MKMLGEKRGLDQLRNIREDFREKIVSTYERRAKNCLTCETQGVCCEDEHFVNVRVSRLEAAAIKEVLSRLSVVRRAGVLARAEEAVSDLSAKETYACPLLEKGSGCLVHADAKPLPCIQHACYENSEDLPPDELLEAVEEKVDRLNRRVYGRAALLRPLPVALLDSVRSSN